VTGSAGDSSQTKSKHASAADSSQTKSKHASAASPSTSRRGSSEARAVGPESPGPDVDTRTVAAAGPPGPSSKVKCSPPRFTWEFLDDNSQWEPMAQELSRAIEKAMERLASARSGEGETTIRVRQYKFNLITLQQTDAENKKVRDIRRKEAVRIELDALLESDQAMVKELALAKQKEAEQEAEIDSLRAELMATVTASRKRVFDLKQDLEQLEGDLRSQRALHNEFLAQQCKQSQQRDTEISELSRVLQRVASKNVSLRLEKEVAAAGERELGFKRDLEQLEGELQSQRKLHDEFLIHQRVEREQSMQKDIEISELARAKQEAASKIESLREELVALGEREFGLKRDLGQREGELRSQRNLTLRRLQNQLKNVRQELVRADCAAAKAKGDIESLAAEKGQLVSRMIGLTGELQCLGFQATVKLLLQARRPDPAKCAPCSLLWPPPCPCALSMDRVLCSFGTYVAAAFRSTVVRHRSNLNGQDFCPAPEFEDDIEVEALTCPDLADRFRLHVSQARERELKEWGPYAAHRVANPPDQMRLLRLALGADMWDESALLGWHGANDTAVVEILADGFNPFCAGSGAGTLFGKGIYFAENSSKADLYAGPSDRRFKKHTGKMKVILLVVFGGNMYEAKSRMERATKPPLPTDACTGIKRFCTPGPLIPYGFEPELDHGL
jgi:hypothetical protein